MGLGGKRVLLTRARPQNRELGERLRALGAVVVEIPTIEITEPESWSEVDRVISELADYDWVVFTSANGVDAFCRRAQDREFPRVAAVGSQTARRVRERGGRVDLVPPDFRAAALLQAFPPNLAGVRILLPRGNMAGAELPDALAARGARVDSVTVYRTRIPARSPARIREAFATGGIDCITFTSGSTVDHLVRMLGVGEPAAYLKGTAIAVIGPVTRSAAEAHGLRIDIEPAEATAAALAEAIGEFFGDGA